jgi:hypothetical protein
LFVLLYLRGVNDDDDDDSLVVDDVVFDAATTADGDVLVSLLLLCTNTGLYSMGGDFLYMDDFVGLLCKRSVTLVVLLGVALLLLLLLLLGVRDMVSIVGGVKDGIVFGIGYRGDTFK